MSGSLCERGFEFGDAPAQGRDCLFDLGRGVARRDVFRAIPVEGNHVDEKEPFDDVPGLRLGELLDQPGCSRASSTRACPRIFSRVRCG